jgi:hypothetical protein
MSTPRIPSGAWRRFSTAILPLLMLPLAQTAEGAASPLASAVQQLRHAVGVWEVTTTQYDDDGAVERVG